MASLYEEFGRHLRLLREGAGLTQQELGERVGLSRTSITNIERGGQQIALHQLCALAAAVGRHPAELLPESAADREQVLPAEALAAMDADPELEEFAVRLLRNHAGVRSKSQRASAGE